MITEIIKACFPLACLLATVFIAIAKPDNTSLQLALVTMGATAYSPKNRDEDL
jgi:hypothetical protein